MKFKVIFILFNVVIVASFLIIYLMPLAMLGVDYTREFWTDNWGLPIVFVAILAILNSYFIINWRLFHLLEAEDWEALKKYVEGRIYEKKRYTAQQIRVLVNSYLITSELQKVRELHLFLEEHDQKAATKHALLLGIPYLLSAEPSEAVGYFSKLDPAEDAHSDGWITWDHAFALLQSGDMDTAKQRFLSLLGATRSLSRDPVLYALTLSMLRKCGGADTSDIISRGKDQIRSKYPPSSWERRVERSKGSVHVVILALLIDDVTDWIYERSTAN